MKLSEFLSLRIAHDEEIRAASGSLDETAAKTYFRAAAIDTAISYIASTLAACEVKVYEKGEERRDGELYRLFNVRPNPVQSAVQMKERFFYKLLYDGDALMVPYRGGLYVADSFGTDKRGIGKTTFTSVSIAGFPAGDYTCDKSFRMSYGNGRTRGLVDGMCDQYNTVLGAAMESYRLASGTKWKLHLDAMPTGTRDFQERDQAEREDPKSALKRFMSGANAVYQETRGQSLEKVDITGSSADDISKIRKEEFEVVASAYKIPLPIVFGNMTNLSENVDAFLTFAIKPLARQFEQEATGSFVDSLDWGKETRLVMDTSRVRNIGIFESAAAISQLIGAGFSLDEVRGQLDWPLIGTEESQRHLITRNFAPLEEALRQIETDGGGE